MTMQNRIGDEFGYAKFNGLEKFGRQIGAACQILKEKLRQAKLRRRQGADR